MISYESACFVIVVAICDFIAVLWHVLLMTSNEFRYM